MFASHTQRKKAFTLIELSVVIVIIGLIVAGIVSGTNLVRQAKLIAITKDVNRYVASINSFKLLYNALPGDIKNASSYFPGANDGNGNNFINWQGTDYEDKLAWQHLALANLINGKYSGSGSGPPYVAGVTVPSGPLPRSAYWLTEAVASNPFSDIWGYGGTNIQFAAQIGSGSSNYPIGPIITAIEAYAIDKKIDDGLPNKGTFMARNGVFAVNPCTSSSAPYTYITSSSDLSCRIFFFISSKR